MNLFCFTEIPRQVSLMRLHSRIPKERLQLPDDTHTPWLLGLSATSDGTRLFAADWVNKAIKSVNLDSLAVHNCYKSDRDVLAVHVLEHIEYKVRCSLLYFTIIKF